MQLNFPRVFPESKTKFTCFINLSWSKDFPPVDTNMEIHTNWREHWNTEIQKYRKAKILEYRNTHVQLIGGLCALIGVFILALPVPIVVNRSHLNKTKNASFINDHKKMITNHDQWKLFQELFFLAATLEAMKQSCPEGNSIILKVGRKRKSGLWWSHAT